MNKVKEYIKNIEKELEELEVKVNSDGSISGKSISLIERNGNKALELTSQIKGAKDVLRILRVNLKE